MKEKRNMMTAITGTDMYSSSSQDRDMIVIPANVFFFRFNQISLSSFQDLIFVTLSHDYAFGVVEAIWD
jgi:hypothetical protein